MGYFMVNTLKNGFDSFLLTIKRFLGVVACIDGDNNNSAFCFCHAFSFHQMATLNLRDRGPYARIFSRPTMNQ